MLDELIAALNGAREAAPEIVATVTAGVAQDVADLHPVLEQRASAQAERAATELTRRAEAEATGLERLLRDRIERLRREQKQDDRQFALLLDEAEARQRAAERRSWDRTATRLDDELVREPERLRAANRVRATRLEPIGMIYLWPAADAADGSPG